MIGSGKVTQLASKSGRPGITGWTEGTAAIQENASLPGKWTDSSLYCPTGNGNIARFKPAYPAGFDPYGLGYNQMIVHFWFRIDSTPTWPVSYCMFFDTQEVSTEVALLLRNNNTISARARFGATTYTTAYYGLNALGSWNHVVIALEESLYLTLGTNGNINQTLGNGTDTLVISGSPTTTTWRLAGNSPGARFSDFVVSKFDDSSMGANRFNSTYNVPTGPISNDRGNYCIFPFDGPSGGPIYDKLD